MPAPLFRRFTAAAPAALNVFAFVPDDITALTFYQLVSNNALLDMVNDPTNAAGIRHEIVMFKNGLDTGRHWFTDSLDPASAGRVAVGPVDIIGPSQLQFSVGQRAGALTAYSFLVKLARP